MNSPNPKTPFPLSKGRQSSIYELGGHARRAVSITRVAGHDLQRCSMLLKMELEFESSKSILQQVPEALLTVIRKLLPMEVAVQ